MTTAEGELEAAVWEAMTAYQVTSAEPLKFIDAVILAAKHYAAGDSEMLTALRRKILHRETGHSPASDCGGDRLAAAELDPSGSAAGGRNVPVGGATRSTARSIPGPVTSRNAGLSTWG